MSGTVSIDAAVAPPRANGVLSFTGTAVAGGTVEIAEQPDGGTLSVIGWATADSAGVWSFAFPGAALGYGTMTLAARALDTDGTPGGWSTGVAYDNVDPEAGLRHVGADLAARLQQDAAGELDATADLQALADKVTDGAPAVLDVPAGSYLISSTILLHSGSYLDAPGVTLEASGAWQRPAPTGDLLGYTMIANADYASDTVLDHDIQIRGVAFDWNGFENFGSAAVRFRSAENLLVQDTTFKGNEDGTAFEHDDGAVVNRATATDTVNYAFDNWEGPENTVIENSVAYVKRFGGISLTGRGTAAGDEAVGSNLSLINNRIYGADTTGIDITSLSAGSQVNHLFVSGNTVDGPGTGILLAGNSDGALIEGNVVSGVIGTPGIQVSNLSLANPGTAALQVRNLLLAGNMVENGLVLNSRTAAIVVQAQDAVIAGNTVQYGSAPWALWVAGTGVLSTGNILDNWQHAAVQTKWSSDTTLQDAPGSAMAPAAGQMSYVLSGGTLTATSSGVLDMRGVAAFAGVTDVRLVEGIGQTVYLPAGAGVHLTVTAATDIQASSIGYGALGLDTGLSIFGAAASDRIDLGTADDAVVVGGPQETLHGGGGDDTFYVTAATAGATIDGGSGSSQLVVTGGGTVTLGAGITGIAAVKIGAIGPTTLLLNALPGLVAVTSNRGDTVTAGAPGQTLVAGLGHDMLSGVAAGGDVFAGRAAELQGDTIGNFALGDTVDVTSVGIADARFAVHLNDTPGMTTLFVLDGHDGMGVNLAGTYDVTRMHLVADPSHGVSVIYQAGIYTVTGQDDIAHVFGLVGAGGADAVVGSSDTMFVGGYLLANGTLTLAADLAPIALPSGASLLIDGGGHTLAAGGWRGLAVGAGDVTLQNLAVTGAGGGITLAAGAGVVRLADTGSFDGGIAIGGGTLDLAATGAAGLGGIGFTAPGAALRIEAGVTVANVIGGLRQHDAITAAGITGGTAGFDPVSHRLTITGTGGSLVLQLDDAAVNSFTTSSDSSGTTVLYAACYCAGTRILTPSGEVAIEALRIGDAVTIADGSPRAVKWIGRRDHDANCVAANPQLRPVLIRAGALGAGLPRRALRVSPTHAVLIDGQLIPAAALVNGGSILRAGIGAVRYVHIELAAHELVRAEGVLAETFIDCASRAAFDNAAEYAALYPDAPCRAPAFCAPRLEQGAALDAVRRRLAGRIRQPVRGALRGHVERVVGRLVEGWAMDEADPDMPVELDVFSDGAPPARVLANRYRIDLDRAGLAGGRCGFRHALPPGAMLAHVRRAESTAALPLNFLPETS